MIPSKTEGYRTAMSFLRTVGIPLMSNYTIVLDDTDVEGINCFNAAFQVTLAAASLMALSAAALL